MINLTNLTETTYEFKTTRRLDLWDAYELALKLNVLFKPGQVTERFFNLEPTIEEGIKAFLAVMDRAGLEVEMDFGKKKKELAKEYASAREADQPT